MHPRKIQYALAAAVAEHNTKLWRKMPVMHGLQLRDCFAVRVEDGGKISDCYIGAL